MIKRLAIDVLLAIFFLSLLSITQLNAQEPAAPQDRSQRFLYPANNGRLTYTAESLGNRVPDYSHCGFRGGNVPLPELQAMVLVDSIEGDATTAIQKAIDYVSDRPLNADGFRGAVLLGPGTFNVEGQLTIWRSGVVLRGSVMPNVPSFDQNPLHLATTIHATGLDRRTLIRICGKGNPQLGNEVNIADNYVAVGSTQLTVAEPVPYRVGTDIVITHPSTSKWIEQVLEY